jgi:DNA-binding CsgD family transcriptional regulator
MMSDVAECRQSLADVVELFGERWAGSGGNEIIDVERFADRGRLRRWLGDVAPLNRRDLLLMRPYFPSVDVLHDSLGSDLEAIERGVRFRLVAAATAARRPGVSHYLDALQEAGAEIRVASSVPLYLLIMDGAVIVTPSPRSEAPGDLVIRSGLVSGCLTEMFEHSWVGAVDYSGAEEPAGLSELDQRVLRMLASGATDKTIARTLGCSDRTLRRMVARMLTEFGVQSRFAAGVRAAQLGLLD